MHTIAMTFWSGCVMMLVAAAPLDQTAPRSDELTLASPSFEDGEAIPLRHTAYGENLSPPLSWTGIPADVGSYAVVVEDSDAPGPLPFVHWVLYNIPGDVSELPEGIAPRPMVDTPAGARQGPNGVRHIGYFGPRPPPGELHRYSFRLFALRSVPDLPEGLDRNTLMEAIRPHIIAEAVIVGTYTPDR